MRISRLLMGLLASGAVVQFASAQFPGGGDRGGRGERGMGGPGGGGMMMGGGRPDPEMIWNFMGGQGKDSINLNDPANQRIKDRMMQRGQAIPANGILTKAEFKTNLERSMAGGGMSGGSTMTMSGAPGAPMMMSVNGAPPTPVGGMGGGMGGMSMTPDQIKQFMSRYDTDKDGRISMAEAQNGRGSLKDSFTQYDTNRDGFIDTNEYTVYISSRFGGGGMASSPGMGGSPWGGQSPQGGMSGGPPGGWGGGSSSSDRGRDRKKDEDSEKVFVYRYGSLPKELPSWFNEMDFDKDGQIAVYEWKNSGKKLDDFNELDLNNDGFVTADEWIRKQALDLSKREIEERMANPNGMMSPTNLRGGSRAPGGWNSGGASSFGSSGMSSVSGSSGRGNPFTSGGPSSRGGGASEDRRNFGGRENARDNKDSKEEKKDRKNRD